MDDRRGSNQKRVNDDHPPFSRIFIVHSKGTTEHEFRDCFEEFGHVEDVWIVKDKRTNEDKGITYIKYAKTSAAVKALDEMNGKTVGSSTRPIKVILANNKQDGSKRDVDDDDKILRLFLMIPKSWSDADLKEEFSKFGNVSYCHVVKDRNSGDSKGLGFVTYNKAYDAAIAYEECDSKFKPKFADPPRRNDEPRRDDDRRGRGRDESRDRHHDRGVRDRLSSRGDSYAAPRGNGMMSGVLGMIDNYSASGNTDLEIYVESVNVNEDQLRGLFDLVPGLNKFEYNRTKGIAYARYRNSDAASYAKEKLNGFEYPPTYPLRVRFYGGPSSASGYDNYGSSQPGEFVNLMRTLQDLAPTLQSLSQITGSGPLGGSSGFGGAPGPDYASSLNLPPTQPKAHVDAECHQRLFFVMQGENLSSRILSDIFCRFGDMIDYFVVPNKNFGYVRYAGAQSAQNAINTLHGQDIMGTYLKVMVAEPQTKRDRERDRDRDGPESKRSRSSWD